MPKDTENPFTATIQLNSLTAGEHQLHVRAKDDKGLWSVVSTRTFAVKTAGEMGIKGDVNGDDMVDIIDVTMTISQVLGQTPEGFNKNAADVNADGKVDIVDVTSIISIVLNQ
ncbi:MAG: dockerin type I repeat-containing protein [Prevotella sp.]|nr:dockerin type I repeat-containing protein [Prevotella sp.]